MKTLQSALDSLKMYIDDHEVDGVYMGKLKDIYNEFRDAEAEKAQLMFNFPQGYKISLIPNPYMQRGNGILMYHPEDKAPYQPKQEG